MRVINGRIGSKINFGEDVSITIGNFDGVHIGHQMLIKKTIETGKTSVIMTFNPHPNCIIKTNFPYYFLTSLDKKIEIIRKYNPDYLYVIDFDRKAATTSKEDFILWLKHLGVKHIICGEDCRFAYKGEGSLIDLKNNFDCVTMKTLFDNDKRISSSYIKELLEKGNVEKASKMLGRFYSIEGRVVEGFHNGEKLGFRTANLDILGNVPPKNGVYGVYVTYNGKKYIGMCNIGYNPTIGKLKTLKLETHIFDFDKMIYGDDINISFVKYIREENKFQSVDELKKQLSKDFENIKNNLK